VCCEALALRWPTTLEEIQYAMAGFSKISFEQAVCNCIGVLDGLLVWIKVPSRKEAGNVRVFFSGHYQCYGVNCQAVTDHFSRFIYFAVAGPGVAKDRESVKHCGLSDMIESLLPKGVCVIADPAYEPTEHMVPVYSGTSETAICQSGINFGGKTESNWQKSAHFLQPATMFLTKLPTLVRHQQKLCPTNNGETFEFEQKGFEQS
jgi:DDE superfamily endonuclease